jgi:2-iminobutanoate/2-iminopropanoate deaminase
MSTPVGPYSPILRAGDWVVISGQIGLVPGASSPTLADGVTAQLRQLLNNARTLLATEGVEFDDVVKTTLFLTDMNDFAACNEVWVEEFATHRPTRSAIAVAALPLGALVEVEMWAYHSTT